MKDGMHPLLCILPFAMLSPDSISFTEMMRYLPGAVEPWTAAEPARMISGDDIFDYMDGAGEVYRAYRYKKLLVQRFTCLNQEDILVEFFDMESPDNAYGIFSYMIGRGPAVPVGQDGEYKNGLLCFWKGKYFAYVQCDDQNETAANAVLSLGKYIADSIPDTGDTPPIVRIIPEELSLSRTLRYFYRFEILNTHFYIANTDILHLGTGTEGVLAILKDGKSRLALLYYPNAAEADSAFAGFVAAYMPDALHVPIIQTENHRWTACAKQKRFIAIVFDASTKEQVANILESITRRIP